MVIKNAKFVKELTKGNLEQGDILIKDGKILEVSENIQCDDNDIIDANGKYVLPGFIDLHVHLNLSGGDVLYDNFKDDYFMCMESYKFALDSLNAGFTTIRDVGSNNSMVNGIRDAINNVGLVGPNIISSGKILSPTENGNQYFVKMYTECDGKETIIKAVREELQKGSDFIKVMASGAVMNPGGNPGSPLYSDEELITMVETAKIKGKYVAAHAHSAEAIKQCFRCGVRTIEHSSMVDEDGIKMALESDTTFLVPTVTAFSGLHSKNEGAEFMNEKSRKYKEKFRDCITNAYKSGVMMGFATDQGITETFHGKNGNEFVYRSEVVGMTNEDILKQATVYSAKIAGIENEVGLVEEGLNADLVILDGNPLENIKVCRDNIHQVIKGGVVCKTAN